MCVYIEREGECMYVCMYVYVGIVGRGVGEADRYIHNEVK